MILWTVLTLMVALAAVGLTFPLARGRAVAASGRASTLDVLKGQLEDIEAQAASGALAPEDAEGLRTEVKRRMLAEGREPAAASRALSDKRLMQLAFAVVGAVALAGTVLYARLGRPELGTPPGATPAAMQADAPDNSTGAHPGGDVYAVIGQLEAQLKANPQDARGWGMLGWSYFQIGRYAQAAKAYGRAAELDPSNAEAISAEGEAIVRSADNRVTPEAEAVFRKALKADAGDPRARYFLAVLKDQQGDHKGAMDDWIALLRTAPAGAPWAAEVRGFVERIAKERGEDISARLPPAPAPPATADAQPAPGPTADQVAAATQMSDKDRQAMIDRMVDTLAARLKANPHDADGWMRLMRARMVLGQADQAAQAYRDAKKALAGSASDLAQLDQAAKGLGVPGA